MICIDSDCIIDFLKGKPEAVEIVGRYKDFILTTEINVFEVYFGVYQKENISDKEEGLVSQLFSKMKILSFDVECGKRGAKLLTSLIKKGKTIGQNDSMIIAILQKNGVEEIITRNNKHFSLVSGVKVISY